MVREQRLGFWAAIASGLLALVGTFVMPVNIVFVLLSFAFAWGIRRGQMWAALAAAAYAIIPMAVLAFQTEAPLVTRVFAIAINLLFAWFFARAALALGRAGGGLGGRPVWIALIVACGAFWIGFHPYSMPSGSMEDTILTNENVLVRNAWGSTLHNGDLVVFRYPPDPKQTFIKRVAGVPGDRIRLENKQLIRNGAPVPEPYVVHRTDYMDAYRDNFPSEANTTLPPQGAAMLAQNVKNGEVVVPEGRYFVLGDNRDDSLDSRYWGFVARDQILGKPFLIYASYQLGSTPDTVARTILNTRWNRLLKVL
jgi:signal peptidase I